MATALLSTPATLLGFGAHFLLQLPTKCWQFLDFSPPQLSVFLLPCPASSSLSLYMAKCKAKQKNEDEGHFPIAPKCQQRGRSHYKQLIREGDSNADPSSTTLRLLRSHVPALTMVLNLSFFW
jgi:hypothetical protein